MAGPALPAGILYVLHNGIAWQLLPPELRFGSGRTCWRCLDRWQKAGTFDQFAPHPAGRTGRARRTRMVSRVCDGSHIRAERGCRHRSVADRPAQDGQQTSPDLRRLRQP
ncbi:transposase [Streptomyces edwardsiae]|uniref:transposase n=1 Tax=Streptomyces edwardsiae TaxID=3075527 RepID=UPI0034D97BCF